jgi:hypothetical protein
MNIPFMTSMRTQLDQRAQNIALVKELWSSLIPGELPNDYSVSLWLSKYDLGTIKIAVEETAAKAFNMVGRMTLDHKVRFASSVMRSKTERTANGDVR